VPARHARKHKWLYESYAINYGTYYSSPVSFMKMFVGWYLNHSKKHNLISFDEGATWIAMRDIKRGEELTIDYDKL